MDLANLLKIKSEVIRKYSEDKSYLSKIDFWSFIKNVNYYSFKTSQSVFNYLKGSQDIQILDERVSSGKLSLLIETEEIKLDDFVANRLEIIQDIEVKTNDLIYHSSNYEINPEFNTKNALNTKEICFFDIKHQSHKLILRLKSENKGFIELQAEV